MAAGFCGRDANKSPKVCHSKLADGITTQWTSLGENVGVATPRSNIAAVVTRFAAENERNNLNPAFDRIGAGVAYVDNAVYAVEVFMHTQAAPTTTTPPTTTPPTTTPPTTTPPTTRPPVSTSPATFPKPPAVSLVPTGGKYSINQTLQVAHDAGFRSEAQLLAVVAIAISESSLVVKQRNWHPEYGCRPAGDALGVPLPAGACAGRTSQQTQSDRGIIQISSRWWPQYSDGQADDPATAMRIMFSISRSGTDFSLWDSHKSGYAPSHYDRAVDGWPALRPLVRAFLA